MDVHLLVYDLSGGLARQMSMGILGFQLDAIYHTSIELAGREYVYDGGILAIVPGSSHLGRPLERQLLGTTNLPMDIVHEYLDSVRPIFTAQAYDLFRHNCNNFTDSFSEFLLGKGIPSHIANMPQAVMDSPMGRMLLPSLTQGMNPARQNGSLLGLEQTAQTAAPTPAPSQNGSASPGVKHVSTVTEFTRVLDGAKSSCAVVFFTSATCPPCKAVYPLYDQLAQQLQGKATLIKVDISLPGAQEIARRYEIRATPTFITFLHGEQENKWTGADPAKLRGNVQLLAQMSSPTHPHNNLKVPSFSSAGSAVLYSKTPPMAKLLAKMGEDRANQPEVQSLKSYLESREKQGLSDTILPKLSGLSELVKSSIKDLPLGATFTIVDLFRCALVDPRISGYFAEEADHQTIREVFRVVNDQSDCPYALRLVTLQMACNLFSTPLFGQEAIQNNALRGALTSFISSSFLDDSHNNVRVAASSLLYNVALANRRARVMKQAAVLPDADQVELAASVVEAIGQEEKSAEALQGMLSALGHLFYEADLEGELADLLRALDAQSTVMSKKKVFPA